MEQPLCHYLYCYLLKMIDPEGYKDFKNKWHTLTEDERKKATKIIIELKKKTIEDRFQMAVNSLKFKKWINDFE